jgi:hypothetical protein
VSPPSVRLPIGRKLAPVGSAVEVDFDMLGTFIGRVPPSAAPTTRHRYLTATACHY